VEVIERFAGVAPIHIAKSHDILTGEIDEVGAAHAANADARDIQRVAGWNESAAKHVPGNDGDDSRGRGGFGQKRAARDRFRRGHPGLHGDAAHYLAPGDFWAIFRDQWGRYYVGR